MSFAVGAPLIALLLAVVVQCCGIIWQRELTAEILRSSAQLMSRSGSQWLANLQFQRRAMSAGLEVGAVTWRTVATSSSRLISAQTYLIIEGPFSKTRIEVNEWVADE